MKTTLTLLTALLLTPITVLRVVDPKPTQRSVVTDQPARHVGKPEGAAEYVSKAAPTDGQHLALTLKKLEQGFDPPRPFLIWALGSSYTNTLGTGEPWKQEIPRAISECAGDSLREDGRQFLPVAIPARLGTASRRTRPTEPRDHLHKRQRRSLRTKLRSYDHAKQQTDLLSI